MLAIPDILARLGQSASPSPQALSPQGRGRIDIGGIFGSARAYMLTRMIEEDPDRTRLVICSTEEAATKLIHDAELFLAESLCARLREFPAADVFPYLKLSPDPVRWADRMERLYELNAHHPVTIITTIAGASRIVPSQTFIANATRELRTGQHIDRDELATWLVEHGYVDVGLVEDEGSFAVRGGIVDAWTPTLDDPVRIELDGDEIVNIRLFDPANQRSSGDLRTVQLIPAGDVCFTKDATKQALENIRKRADDKGLPGPDKRLILERVRERITFEGIETFAPFFHTQAATIIDYLPENCLVILDDPDDVRDQSRTHLEKLRDLAATSTSLETLVEPEELYRSADEIIEAASRCQTMSWQTPDAGINVTIHPTSDIRALVAQHKPDEDILSPLVARLDEWKRKKYRTSFICHTPAQADRMADLFRWQGLSTGSMKITVGRLSEGFVWPNEGIAFVTDEEVFGKKVVRRPPTKPPIEHFTSFAELSEGDSLVHEHHGIGRYSGMQHMSIQNVEGDYLLLEYLGGDKLYLPVYRMNLVQRYVGSGDNVPVLDRLGGTRWGRVTKKVRQQVMRMAKELLEIHATREVHGGFPYPEPDAHYEEFCAAFPYDETPDQLTAIDDVVRDLQLERPADRLICGDVGYGKTEVAMRAAFKAAMAGKQVAVLVPTTILALQHYENFTTRFKETAVRIGMLSRFRTAKQQKEVVANAQKGIVDIVIGTHRMLSKDIGFKDLGLVIVDEEQRFGVRHKEKLKKLKTTVDVITLTATPIPRTLQLSLTGIRDISIINTPPADRQSITTHVVPFDETVIRHAITDEISRGGQVFFVHNRVKTMPSMFARLKRTVPEAAMVMAHGQMHEHELEDVMINFLEKKFNVLVCTAIIESGLDISNANTIIINRADTFGLAQLYQLRGRVGRSSVKAQAYLLTPQDETITQNAKKRLMVLKRFTELGSGFQIATHDLEIRGAGNFLGSAQSGHIAEIGYELYTKLLARAVRKLSGKTVQEEIDPELKLMVEAFLPESYVPEPGARLDCYRRLSSCTTDEQIEAINSELVDRFGPLPQEAMHLLGIMFVKVIAQRLRIATITFDGRIFACRFDKSTPLDPTDVAKLAAQHPSRFRLHPPDRLLVMAGELSGPESIIQEARNFLSELETCVTPPHSPNN